MPRFAYSAVDPSGKLLTGEVNAKDDLAASDEVARKGLTLVSLGPAGSGIPWWQRDVILFGGGSKLTLEKQELFFRNLNSMLGAGFSLRRTLDFVATQARDSTSKRLFVEISSEVASGSTLANAAEQSGAFEARLIGLIDMGERANQLQTVSKSISDMLTTEIKTVSEIRQALVYPMILLAMSLLVIAMLVFFLAPTLVPVFQSAGVETPRMLKILDLVGTALVESWVFVMTGLFALMLGGFLLGKTILERSKRVLATLPGLKTYIRSRSTLQFVQTVHLMLQSGAQLPMALAAAADTASSSRWRAAIQKIQRQVEAGEGFYAPALDSGLFDASALAFFEAGETGDQLGPMLGQCSSVLAQQIRSQLSTVLRLLIPVLTLVIGLSIGFLIFSTIGAILDLNDLAV